MGAREAADPLDDGMESRRFVGFDEMLINIITPRYGPGRDLKRAARRRRSAHLEHVLFTAGAREVVLDEQQVVAGALDGRQ
jgi:hypothetical protein